MKDLIHNSSNLCRKTPNVGTSPNVRISPKKKNILLSRLYSRSRPYNCPKLNVSRRSSTESSKSKSTGAYEKVLFKLKKCCTASQTWSVKVIDVCTQLGVQLKNVIRSINWVQVIIEAVLTWLFSFKLQDKYSSTRSDKRA